MTAVTWAVRAFFAVYAAFWAVIGAAAVRNWLKRGRAAELADPDRHEPSDDISRALTSGSKLPGPDRPQPSGVGPGDDTRIGEWTPRELAFLRGEEETPS